MLKKFLLVLMIVPLLMFAGCDTVNAAEEDAVASISVEESFKRDYFVNENVDFSSFKIQVTYVSGQTAYEPLSKAVVTGFDTSVAGEKDVTIEYAGFTISFKILVKTPEAVALRVSEEKFVFFYGEEPDYSFLSATILYSDASEKVVSLDECEITLEGEESGKMTISSDGVSSTIDFEKRYHEIDKTKTYAVNFSAVSETLYAGFEYEGILFLYSDEEKLFPVSALSIEDMGDGHFETEYLSGGENKTYSIFLANGVINIVEKENVA